MLLALLRVSWPCEEVLEYVADKSKRAILQLFEFRTDYTANHAQLETRMLVAMLKTKPLSPVQIFARPQLWNGMRDLKSSRRSRGTPAPTACRAAARSGPAPANDNACLRMSVPARTYSNS